MNDVCPRKHPLDKHLFWYIHGNKPHSKKPIIYFFILCQLGNNYYTTLQFIIFSTKQKKNVVQIELWIYSVLHVTWNIYKFLAYLGFQKKVTIYTGLFLPIFEKIIQYLTNLGSDKNLFLEN